MRYRLKTKDRYPERVATWALSPKRRRDPKLLWHAMRKSVGLNQQLVVSTVSRFRLERKIEEQRLWQKAAEQRLRQRTAHA